MTCKMLVQCLLIICKYALDCFLCPYFLKLGTHSMCYKKICHQRAAEIIDADPWRPIGLEVMSLGTDSTDLFI